MSDKLQELMTSFDVNSWIGRSQATEDEITLSAVRKMAAATDLNPEDFGPKSALPPHWYSMFFTQNARQSQLGHDGHPRKGDFLPPIPLPRRMFVGRHVAFPHRLHVGDHAVKRSDIAAITPKLGRSGPLIFLTVRHTIEVGGVAAVIEDQEVVYRQEANSNSGSGAVSSGVLAPSGADWSDVMTIDPVLVFRYSALTWNGHRIHYDADYARSQEGYPACVMNGALTVHLLVDAAMRRTNRRLTALTARLARPLFVGETMTLAGQDPDETGVEAWVAREDGQLACSLKLTLAP